jgi:hypothetical protein
MTVGGCTTLILNCFNTLKEDKFYEQMKQKLSNIDIDKAIEDWASGENWKIKLKPSVPPPKKKETILLIWSRYSGSAPNGYNPAGDSSVLGQKEIIKLAEGLNLFNTIITIGHNPDENTHTPKGDIHLGEFWKEAGSPFDGKGRPEQTSFYRLLAECYNVVQVGQKTGGMDNAALIGIPTVYIEDKGSPQSARMQKWSNGMKRYKRAEVPEPPTPLGKALRKVQLKGPDKTSDKGKNLADAMKLVAEGKEKDGYQVGGVETIKTALKVMMKDMGWSKL